MTEALKYHFIGSLKTGDDPEDLRKLTWEEGIVACTRHTWVWALYCQMKSRGLPVSFSYTPEPGAVNIVHGQVARRQLTALSIRRCFIIGIRADFRPFPYGQFEIVQNQNAVGNRSFYMPLYPQPGLLSRNENRHNVTNICFAGRLQNCFDLDRMQQDLKGIDCQFVFRDIGEWQDMRDVDILLGIRSLSRDSYNSKPPTKMFNAWLADIPFIGGYDSAYEQTGRPGENYLRVSSYEELMEAITNLKNDSDLYQRLVREGAKAGAAYTPEKITDLWLNFFEDEVKLRYNEWAKRTLRIRLQSVVQSIRFWFREQFIPRLLNKQPVR